MTVPTGSPMPTRFNVPAAMTGDVETPLEFCYWPLYSAAAYDAAALPRELEFFNYTVGETVSGAGVAATSATQMHTNMLAPRTVPRPKIFTCQGIRVICPPMTYTATTVTEKETGSGASYAAATQFADLINITQTGQLEFNIGEKNYVRSPLWNMPANAGVGGVADASAGSAAADVFMRRLSLSTAGQMYAFSTGRKPVLWHSQTFTMKLFFNWTGFGTNQGSTSLIYVVLDGTLGRELQ